MQNLHIFMFTNENSKIYTSSRFPFDRGRLLFNNSTSILKLANVLQPILQTEREIIQFSKSDAIFQREIFEETIENGER